MADEQGEKTEKPTPKRLKDAREKGQVASSRDLSASLASLAATGVLVAAGPLLLGRLSGELTRGLSTFAAAATGNVTAEDLTPLVMSGATLIALTAGPVALAAAIVGVFSSTLQSGFNLSFETLQPNWTRLSPSNGFSRLAPSKAGVDTVKAILATTIVCALAWKVTQQATLDAPRMPFLAPVTSAIAGWELTTRLLWQASFALLALGGADYGVQRWRLMKSLKMSKQEIREESKMNDGNPEIKARVRRVARDMVRRRLMAAVPNATVVLVNPTHFAVALEYKKGSHAPIVVAKGADVVAARIRELARQHQVPIVENPPLTRALFKECEIGDSIPGSLFGAVAEVLAYLIRIKQLAL